MKSSPTVDTCQGRSFQCFHDTVVKKKEQRLHPHPLPATRGWTGDPSGNGHGYTEAGKLPDDRLAEADRPAMLFPLDQPRDARPTDALDTINDRFGKKTVVLGREGVRGDWATKAEPRSPRYTTRIIELPVLEV